VVGLLWYWFVLPMVILFRFVQESKRFIFEMLSAADGRAEEKARCTSCWLYHGNYFVSYYFVVYNRRMNIMSCICHPTLVGVAEA